MSPKEKADELKERCFQASRITMQGAAGIFRQNAKNVALIVAQEVLNEFPRGVENSFEQKRILYWQQVKDELNNL